MTDTKSSLSLVDESKPQVRSVSAEEFMAGFMKFATSLVEFETAQQPMPQRKVRVSSLESLRVKATSPKTPEVNAGDTHEDAESATVMPFRRATDPQSGNR